MKFIFETSNILGRYDIEILLLLRLKNISSNNLLIHSGMINA